MKNKFDLRELPKKPILRNDQGLEFLNKMTDEEIIEYDKSVEVLLDKRGVPHKFPDRNSERLSQNIDDEILYTILKQALDEKI